MKIKTKYSLIIITILTLSFGCKKFINIEPKQVLVNDKAITTVSDLTAVLNGAYDGMQSGNVLGGNAKEYMDLMADDGNINTSLLAPFGTQEIYNGATSVQIQALRSMWSETYATINRANNVIATIDANKLSGTDYNAIKDRYKGEALFIRAICHFNLLQLWALPYDLNHPGSNTQPGVVIRTVPTFGYTDPTIIKQRSSVEDCYTQVISDLNDATDYLNKAGVVTSKDKASALAAKALLTRVYFYKGDYSNANNFANQVINTNNFKLQDTTNINTYFANTGDQIYGGNSETIFQLVNIATDASNACPGYYSRKNAGASPIFKYYDNFLSLFDVNDKRSSLLVFNFGSKYINKYDYTTGSTIPPNIVLLRLSEMHLIRAEAALLGGGSTQDAIDSYNQLRKRYTTSYTPVTTTDSLLQKVQLEHRLELAFEGDRYMNLRRLGLPLRDGTTNYAKYLFKIPQEEIAGNPTITQNP